MIRTIVIWGVLLALAAFALDYLKYGYFVRAFPVQVYVAIVATVFAAGGAYLGWRLTARRAGAFERNDQALASLGLTPQEVRVLERLASGQSNKEIARALGLSPNTVKTHLANLFEKLEVSRRTQAIGQARDLRLIPWAHRATGDRFHPFGRWPRSCGASHPRRSNPCEASMTRTILTWGLIGGLIIILGSAASFALTGGGHHTADTALGYVLGYLVMLVALSSVLVGVRQYRDREKGGVIRFLPAFGMGLGIALMASLAYVAVWEVYLAVTHYRFIDEYTSGLLASKRAAGVTGAAYAKLVAQMDDMRRSYANPLIRMGMTFTEIAPVGLVVALVSAALLRNPRFLPAKTVA